MKASTCIKKFVHHWVNVKLRNGLKLTMKICEVINAMGIAIVKYVVVGCREMKQINRSEIIEVYA